MQRTPVSALSPNQQAKRREIVGAAKSVLLRDGLEGCTARVLAEESSFSRSAIHYYFGSMEEVVDAAMDSLFDDFLADLRAVAAEHDDPAERFWAVTRRYLTVFAEDRRLSVLWFDWLLSSVQDERPAAVIRMETALYELLAGLLRGCGVEESETRAQALLAYMIGSALRGILHPVPLTKIRRQLATLSGIS